MRLDMFFQTKTYVAALKRRALLCPPPSRFDHQHEKDTDGQLGYNGGGGEFTAGLMSEPRCFDADGVCFDVQGLDTG